MNTGEMRGKPELDSLTVMSSWNFLADPNARLQGSHPHWKLHLTKPTPEKFESGMRVKIIDNDKSIHFFILTAAVGPDNEVSPSILHLFSGSARAVIVPGPLQIFYSYIKTPEGFPTNPKRWTLYAAKPRKDPCRVPGPLMKRRAISLRKAMKIIQDHYGGHIEAARALKITPRSWQRWLTEVSPSPFTRDRLMEHAILILLDLEALDVDRLEPAAEYNEEA